MAVTDGQLDVVVRFSTSNPDVVLRVERPSAITALTLKQRIRAELPSPASTGRLRLIHAGKVVQDTAALSKSLTHILTPPPPSANANGNDEDDIPISAKAKGKQPIRDEPLRGSVAATAVAAVARVYVHCSIGDALTSAELATEAKDAQEADDALVWSTQNSLLGNTAAAAAAGAGSRLNNGQPEATTTPAPRGFDRLLSTGFTASEVAALRTQFLAIQAHTHTPDTMPSGPELLALEEQWLDNGSNAAGSGGEGGEGGGGFGAEDAGALEDMLHGNLIGFFWPVGAMFWLMREEGVWSRRKQISVLSGFLVNITFGFLRILN